MTKIKEIRKHYKAMLKLYPQMDKRKIRRDTYLRYSAKWKALLKARPDSLIHLL